MLEEVVGSSVNRLGGDDVVAGLGEVEDRVRDRCRPRGEGERRRPSLESGDTFLENVLRRVRQTPYMFPASLNPNRSAACCELWNTYDVVR